jgi:hypothetical protein
MISVLVGIMSSLLIFVTFVRFGRTHYVALKLIVFSIFGLLLGITLQVSTQTTEPNLGLLGLVMITVSSFSVSIIISVNMKTKVLE